MSEQPHDTDEIINEMQMLDDIEADLADTALAFVSGAEGEAEESNDASEKQALEQNAVAMESVLEQAIPDAPAPAAQSQNIDAGSIVTDPIPSLPSGDFDMTDTYSPAPASTLQPPLSAAPIPAPGTEPDTTPIPALLQSAAVPTPVSSATQGVQEAILAVQADVNVPILPPTVEDAPKVEPEPSAEQQAQEDVQMEETSIASIPLPASIPARPVADVKPIIESQAAEVKPPNGLTNLSPSVAQNPALVQAWSRGEHTGRRC